MQTNLNNPSRNIRELIFAYKNSVSFDTETTGLDEHTNRIWQVGGSDSSGNTFNKYIKIADTPYSAARKLRKDSGKEFFDKQRVNIKKYLSALSGGDYIEEKDTLKFLSEKFKGRHILMHNHNFEGRFLGEVARRNPGSADEIIDGLRYKTESNNSRFLFRPPEVQNASVAADDSYNKFILGEGSHSDVVSARRNVIAAYASSVSTANKSIIIDNMDVSKMLLSELAEKNLINKRTYAFSGSSMEFISKHFLGEEEIHDAVSDAIQTKNAGIKMLRLAERLIDDKLLPSDLNLISNISNDIDNNISKSILRSVNKAVQESETQFGRKPFSRYTEVTRGAFLIEDNGSGGVIKHQINRLVHKYRTPKDHWIKEKIAAAEDAIKQYSGISREVDNMVFNAIGAIRNGKEITEDVISGNLNVDGSKELVRNMAIRARNTASAHWYGLSPAGKVATGLAAGAIALSGFTNSGNSKENIEKIKEKKEAIRSKSYSNSTLNMYTNIENYHGSGFVSWNNRTGHHEY